MRARAHKNGGSDAAVTDEAGYWRDNEHFYGHLDNRRNISLILPRRKVWVFLLLLLFCFILLFLLLLGFF